MPVAHVALMVAQGKQFILVRPRHLRRLSRMVCSCNILWHPPRQIQGRLPSRRENDRCLGLVIEETTTSRDETLEMDQEDRR